MLTDSLSLFDVVTKATVTTEKRLMIDIQVVKDSYHRNEIEHISFIRSEYNPADALTKVRPNSILESIFSSSRLIPTVEQWIQRQWNEQNDCFPFKVASVGEWDYHYVLELQYRYI